MRLKLLNKFALIVLWLFSLSLAYSTSLLAGETPDSIQESNQTEAILNPQMALQRLMEGNKRFAEDKTTCPDRNQMRRLALISKQRPFAVILGCSDSRIPPEIAFDQGIGDVFVVRVAGNIVSAVELDSVEYSAIYNHSSIIMVVGHENCGAIQAVLDNQTQDIETIANLIKPGLEKLKKEKPISLLSATEANVQNSVNKIKQSKAISKLIKEGKIDVVGAYYDFETGLVRTLEPL